MREERVILYICGGDLLTYLRGNRNKQKLCIQMVEQKLVLSVTIFIGIYECQTGNPT